MKGISAGTEYELKYEHRSNRLNCLRVVKGH